MSRITRAKAAEVAEQLHIDEDALLELNSHDRQDILLQSTSEDRAPLCEVSPNSASSKHDDAEAQFVHTTPEKRVKKSKQRAQKGKKANTLNANAGAVDASHLPVHDIRTAPTNAVQHLRSTPSDELSASQHAGLTKASSGESAGQDTEQPESEILVSEVSVEPPVTTSEEAMPNVLQAQVSTPTKSPSAAKPELAGMENVEPNGEYDQLEKAVVEASTPPRPSESPLIPAASKPTYNHFETAMHSAVNSTRSSVSATMPDDPIEALDAQDEAVEKVAAEVPDVQDSPQKPQKKSMPPVRLTKASQARISLAHGLPDAPFKAPAMGRPRQSLSQSTSKRVTSTSSVKSGADAAEEASAVKKEVVIPHSKPRPMSMQFKPPPPPAKSTRAPTKSNFQLPGEVVAAKFKAAKEARRQKEAEEQKRKAFKARPAPNMNKTPTVRQTSTSKARESIMNPGKPASLGASRPMSVATSRPATTGRPTTSSSKSSVSSRPSTARVSIAPNTKQLAVKKRPISMMASSTSKARPPTLLGTSTSKARPATVLGMNSRPRTSLAPKPNPPESVRPTFQAGKGKEVFNRAAEAKATAEQQKREKEEAAKKARLEASERSRQLSRDWAEKQKMKKMASVA